jgi:uncharacterized Tic20 family protein
MSFLKPEMPAGPLAQDKDEKLWGMLAHLSALLLGFIGPLVVWLIQKDKYPFVDDQGKESLNFQISMMIYFLATGASLFVCIGVVLFPAAVLFNIIMIVIASIKANDGKPYRYPLCIRLIS